MREISGIPNSPTPYLDNWYPAFCVSSSTHGFPKVSVSDPPMLRTRKARVHVTSRVHPKRVAVRFGMIPLRYYSDFASCCS